MRPPWAMQGPGEHVPESHCEARPCASQTLTRPPRGATVPSGLAGGVSKSLSLHRGPRLPLSRVTESAVAAMAGAGGGGTEGRGGLDILLSLGLCDLKVGPRRRGLGAGWGIPTGKREGPTLPRGPPGRGGGRILSEGRLDAGGDPLKQARSQPGLGGH